MRKSSLSLALSAAALVLMGQGCPLRPAPALDLPTEPPPEPPIGLTETEINDQEAFREESKPASDGTETRREGLRGAQENPLYEEDKASAKAPYYIAYSAEAAAQARAEGRPVVYYFWAAWCPVCRADEPVIKARIEGSGLPIAGFRVNFDAQTDLKARYKIPYQHTTVFLNAEGEEVARLSGPVGDAEFLAKLKLAASK